MNIVFNMSLPRDAVSVPVVRHICRDALRTLGVQQECIEDIELAVTEACTNVLRHAAADSQGSYDVDVEIGELVSTIRVRDSGSGFGAGSTIASISDLQETGRGIHLMKALVDELSFSSRPDRGTSVQLEKALVLSKNSVLRQLISAT